MSRLSRRRFLGGAGATLALLAPRLLAAPAGRAAAAAPATLQGTEFDLTIGETPVDFSGRTRMGTSVNGGVPGPTLRWREGTTVTLRLHNRLAVASSIHWHGIVLPSGMDGVPGISFPGIAPGQSFTASFPVRQSGTYWYHGHSRFQEQTGLYGAIVIDPAGPDPIQADRDHVLLFSDWSDQDPERIYANLKRVSDYYNHQIPDVATFIRDVRTSGLGGALAKRRLWNGMRMNPTDFSDVSAPTYTYLVNNAAPAANWTALARAGERVRLRLINGSSATFFDVRIPGLSMTVVSADGQRIAPVTVDELRMGAGETFDVIVRPPEDRAYTVFAQSMDRSGYARATLAPRPGMRAEVPPPDPGAWLGPEDIGMSAPMAMTGDANPSMDMSHPMDMRSRDPAVDMRIMHPNAALNDPGPRLRANGRRELTYADLRGLEAPGDTRAAGREITLHLTGNMQRFIWGFDGRKYSESVPLRLGLGERVRIVLHNDTVMSHPIHLHGMFGELEAADGTLLLRKHTFVVQPGRRLSYLLTADNPGRWALHCHLLYHMAAGMFRELVVA